ncbi:MAG: hypothetical protein KatS3mg003_0732 [Candidatus Nitrosocaldaceae archaeon]|nr:MAG: hypothetical protein KatS3mg003_0732 [Candidatus Nitrosocaldaceae archaeon]
MNSEEKRELLKWMYNLGIPFMAFRSDKSPIVNDYINYLDHTKRLSLEDTIKYLEEGYLIAKIEGKLFNNEKYSFAIEAENNKVKHGKGLDIGITYTILKRFLNFYKINEYTLINTTMHEGKRHNYLTNGLLQNKKFEEIGIEIIGNRHASIFLGDGYEVYNAKHLEFVDNSIVNEMSKGLELFNNIVKALKPYYKEGVRDIICLALSGYLRKKGYDIEFAKFMVENVCIAFNDEEKDNRIKQCVEQTYKQDIERVSGYKIAKEVSEDLANALSKVFGIKERDEDILTVLKSLGYSKAYNLALGLLRYDLDNNKKEAEFIKDYIYVMEKPANRDETKGNWYHWNKCKWEEINYNQLVKRLTSYVRDKKDHLELEMEEILQEYDKRIRELEEEVERAKDGRDNTTFDIYKRELANLQADKKHVEKTYRDYYKELEECIASGNKRNELLHTLETDDRFKEFHIMKYMLDSYNDLAINTKTHLLVYDNMIKRYIPIEHGENTKKYYPTKVMNVNYNANAKCIRFAEFLKTITLNNRDLAIFLATVLGLCMIKRIEEVAFIFHGYGNNGKSTLLEVAKDIMNDYVRDSNISLISNREDEGKNPEFVACVDKHLVVIDEPTRVKIVGRLLKALISTGKRSARTLNARPQEYEKTFNLIISTNPEPEIDDDTVGTYRRLCIVPFEYSIPEDKIILNYHKILLEEREGIFNMLLAGLERYLEVNNLRLLMPEVVKRYTFGMIWKDDHIKEFADRYLEKAEGINTPFKDIYEKYLEFCSYKNVKPLSKKTVSKLLDKKGFASKIIEKITYKLNCSIKDKPDLEDITSDLDDNNTNTQNENNNTNNNTDSKEEKQDTKPKQEEKIQKLYLVNNGEIERIRRCIKCKEEIPKGLSISMFIAKHKCFRDKEVEVRIIDSKNREWIYRKTSEAFNKFFNEFECSNCKKTATVDIEVDDESLDAVFLSDHECN